MTAANATSPPPRLREGDLAPDFALPAAGGDEVRLSDVRGTGVVLFFYPKAGTPGCTTEACDFRDNHAALAADGYTVIGISPDPIAALEEFARTQGLPYPLLSDADLAVHRRYGCWGHKVADGRTQVGALRSTFVLDGAGIVRVAQYSVPAVGHVWRLREQLRQGSAS